MVALAQREETRRGVGGSPGPPVRSEFPKVREMLKDELSESEPAELTESELAHSRLCACWLEALMFELKAIPSRPLAESGQSECWERVGLSGRAMFERYVYEYAWGRLLRYALSPARGISLGQEAEELVSEALQDATLRFLERLKRQWPMEFPSFIHARAYFFVVSRNCLVDLLRKRLREQKRREEPRQPVLWTEILQQWPEVGQWDWDSMRVSVERWLALRCVALDRHLLIERFFSSPPRSYKEIAESLTEESKEPNARFSAGQLRVRKHRLVRDLVGWLKEEFEKHA